MRLGFQNPAGLGIVLIVICIIGIVSSFGQPGPLTWWQLAYPVLGYGALLIPAVDLIRNPWGERDLEHPRLRKVLTVLWLSCLVLGIIGWIVDHWQ
jgi:hypothetical protein